MNDIKNIEFLKTFYCQHVLPLVYDESLSYYEQLCKIKAKVNEVIASQNELAENFKNLTKWIDEQLELYTKGQLQEWLDNGTLENIINETLFMNLNQRRYNVLYPPINFDPLDNTGIHDNTEKLQKLIDNEIPLFFPKGKYLFNNQVLSNGHNIDMLGVFNETIIKAQKGTNILYIFDFTLSDNIYMENFLFHDNMVKIMSDYNQNDALEMYRNMMNKNYCIKNVFCKNDTKEIGYTNWDNFIVNKKPINYTPYKNGEYARYPMDIINYSGFNALNITNLALNETGEITSANESSAIGIIHGNNSGTPMILLDNRGDSHILQLYSSKRIDITSEKKKGVILDINQLGQIAIGCMCDFDEPVAKRLADLKIYNKRPNIAMFDVNGNSFDLVLDDESNSGAFIYNGINLFEFKNINNNDIINNATHYYNAFIKIINPTELKWSCEYSINEYGIPTYNYYDNGRLVQSLINQANFNGDTGTRPTTLSDNDKGFMFFDNTINKPIWWDGIKWIDSQGNNV